MKKILVIFYTLLILLLVACSTGSGDVPSDNPNTDYDESITPSKGQPDFPKLGQYWVIDQKNACNFSEESVRDAHEVFEALSREHYAQVAVVCQTGIQDNGPMNNHLIWAMDWGNYVRLGSLEDKRGLVWVIRPDVPPEKHRVVLENSIWLFENTAVDYGDMLDEAANYANFNDFSGALDSIARNTNEVLRKFVNPSYKP